MKTYTETLPAHFASALVNNDSSGLNLEELLELDDIQQLNYNAVDCSESYIGRFDGKLCQVCDFTFYY
jgi:hypothetical protein